MLSQAKIRRARNGYGELITFIVIDGAIESVMKTVSDGMVKNLWRRSSGAICPQDLLALWDAVNAGRFAKDGTRLPRSLEALYTEIGRVIDKMPDGSSTYTTYIDTDDGRPLVTTKSYLKELQLDLDRHISRREPNGRFASRQST